MILESCVLCPRKCRINRLQGRLGYCRSGPYAKTASVNLHFGEEPPISGYTGSGTIFFSSCTLKCIYCQNYPISHLNNGEEITDEELADHMIDLQNRGAHNINLVTPTHMLPSIVRALLKAIDKSLVIPLVYNSSGYETLETLDLLKYIIDIYMPDAKYAASDTAEKYSDAPDYPNVNRAAIKQMFLQTGNLSINKRGTATRGLLVRHLVLPHRIKEAKEILRFLHHDISPDIYVSLMAQYHPAYKAHAYPEMNKHISDSEYNDVLACAEKLHLDNGWRQHV
ncbi:MAG: radical SAM protein [bacterium]